MRMRAEKEPGRSRAKDGGLMLTHRGVIWPVLISGLGVKCQVLTEPASFRPPAPRL